MIKYFFHAFVNFSSSDFIVVALFLFTFHCWNLSGPNLRPETNPRRLTASYPSVPYLIIIPTYHRTIPAPNYYADAALRSLGGHLITTVRLSSRTLWLAPTHLRIPRHRVEQHSPYDGYSMTHHHCPYRLGRTDRIPPN